MYIGYAYRLYITYIYIYIYMYMHIYVYIYVDLLSSSSYSNLTMVTSLSSATRRKTIKVVTVHNHLPYTNSDKIKMQNQKIQKKKMT